MDLIALKDDSLVSPGVFAENELDVVSRAREYGYPLTGPQLRCINAAENGRPGFWGESGRCFDTATGFLQLLSEVMAWLEWLVAPHSLTWDATTHELVLTWAGG